MGYLFFVALILVSCIIGKVIHAFQTNPNCLSDRILLI